MAYRIEPFPMALHDLRSFVAFLNAVLCTVLWHDKISPNLEHHVVSLQ